MAMADLIPSLLTRFRYARAEDARSFETLVAVTRRLIGEGGMDPAVLSDGFIEYWISRGKSPDDVSQMALGIHPGKRRQQ